MGRPIDRDKLHACITLLRQGVAWKQVARDTGVSPMTALKYRNLIQEGKSDDEMLSGSKPIAGLASAIDDATKESIAESILVRKRHQRPQPQAEVIEPGQDAPKSRQLILAKLRLVETQNMMERMERNFDLQSAALEVLADDSINLTGFQGFDMDDHARLTAVINGSKVVAQTMRIVVETRKIMLELVPSLQVRAFIDKVKETVKRQLPQEQQLQIMAELDAEVERLEQGLARGRR